MPAARRAGTTQPALHGRH